MQDDTEDLRRARIVELNQSLSQDDAIALATLQAQYGRVWTSAELREEFTVTGFAAPYVVVKRKRDGQVGSMEFTHMPRFYFNYQADQ